MMVRKNFPSLNVCTEFFEEREEAFWSCQTTKGEDLRSRKRLNRSENDLLVFLPTNCFWHKAACIDSCWRSQANDNFLKPLHPCFIVSLGYLSNDYLRGSSKI